MNRRVVITGLGIVSPLGNSLGDVAQRVRNSETGIVSMPEWKDIGHFSPRVAAIAHVPEIDEIPRKASRTMGRVALLATIATKKALQSARLDQSELQSGRVGLAYGSTHGSSSANEEWIRKLVTQNGFLGLASTTYLKFMSHTTAANLAIYFGIQGRVICTSSACVSASQAVGYGYEMIKYGLMNTMICGGAEEMHFSHAGVFDIMYAASVKYNDRPYETPRPFDRDRDGLVVGEGAGTFVLEEYNQAVREKKTIYAEVLGFGTNCDGTHVTSPSKNGMQGAMILALRDANMHPSRISYVNAHATATDIGDVAESEATFAVFGSNVPVSSLKGHFGHTLGACGTIEAALCINMMRESWIAQTRNLSHIDPRCAKLDYVMQEPRHQRVDMVMCNKFAFGGINTSLILGPDPS